MLALCELANGERLRLLPALRVNLLILLAAWRAFVFDEPSFPEVFSGA